MDIVVFGRTETGKGARLPFEGPQTDRVRHGRSSCGTFILDLDSNNKAYWQVLQTVDLRLPCQISFPSPLIVFQQSLFCLDLFVCMFPHPSSGL